MTDRNWEQIQLDVARVGDAQQAIVEMAADCYDTSNDTEEVLKYYRGLYELGEASAILYTRIKLLGWDELDAYVIAMMEMAEMMGIRREETIHDFHLAMMKEANECVKEMTGEPIDPT
ncbi:hypothetical protein [Synechococcus phage S-B68]|nr:hypothetical protein [Synechococcus phage S-B68]